MQLPLYNITQVAEHGLCCGCGACASVDERISMVDDFDQGRRPILNGDSNATTEEGMRVCPGIELSHESNASKKPELIQELFPGFGPVMEMWEGHAADSEIRFAGSSGGAASAIALHCLEHESMHGVLHTAARKDVPYLNESVMSRSRDELLARTGSRYAPASPCDSFGAIESAPAKCVFIGKPCDVAAANKARKLRQSLDDKLGVTIGFFCAGTPSTRGTLEMLKRMGVSDPTSLVSLRYRGNGWPGLATAVYRQPDGAERSETLTYESSWGDVLTSHKQWRCKICVDHTGEFADIAVGDPWYRKVEPGEAGSSLILARTERGRQIIKRAIDSGKLIATSAESWKLPASQPNLLKTRGAVWGRRLACRLVGMPSPKYSGLPAFRFWLTRLSMAEKASSIGGTIKRVFRRGLRQRVEVKPFEAIPKDL